MAEGTLVTLLHDLRKDYHSFKKLTENYMKQTESQFTTIGVQLQTVRRQMEAIVLDMNNRFAAMSSSPQNMNNQKSADAIYGGSSSHNYLVCQLDNVQGMFDALTAVRWKPHQDVVLELSELGIVFDVEEIGVHAKVYMQRKLFIRYEYGAQGIHRFGVSLDLLVDGLNTFVVPGRSSMIEIRYSGPDMQLLLKSVDPLDACIYAEIRTRIADTISWDYNFEPAGSTPLNFTVKVAALKEAIDDLELPGSSIQIMLQPDPPSVTFRGEGHVDLQIDFMYSANTDLLIAFSCDRQVSYRYKYKFLRATTSNIPSSVIKDDRGIKLAIGRGGMLKVQYLVSVSRPSIPHPHIDFTEQPSGIAYIEFLVKPEEDEDM